MAGAATVASNLSGVELNDLLRRQWTQYLDTLAPDDAERIGSRRTSASRSRDDPHESDRRTRRRGGALTNAELSQRGVRIDLDNCDQELLRLLRHCENSPSRGYETFYHNMLAQPQAIRAALIEKGNSMVNSPDAQVRCGGFVNALIAARQAWKREVHGTSRSSAKWLCQCGARSFMDWDVCSSCAGLRVNSLVEHPWQSPPPRSPAARTSQRSSSGGNPPAQGSAS